MAEELAFARKASGLVRGLSMTDAFAVGMMNQGITPSIWTMVTWGLGTYMTGSLLWASVISLVLVGLRLSARVGHPLREHAALGR